MLLWHQELPNKYAAIEKFNHGYPANLPVKLGTKTLEVGAGIGGHLGYEDLKNQEYHCLEYREEFCTELKKAVPPEQVHCGDIQKRQPWSDQFFDRIVSIHVLEHLPDLPAALEEIARLLKDDGVFDIVIPCDGGLAYRFARSISSKRMFEKNFGIPFEPIIRAEHLSSYPEIHEELLRKFEVENRCFFPLRIPSYQINLAVGFRLRKKIK